MDEARLRALGALDFSPFAPRAPWWGGDLQTLSNYLRLPARLGSYPATRLILPLADGSGDRLAATLHPRATRRPLVALIHGLSGDEDSPYIRRSAATLLALGYPVLRLNLRGAGPSRPLSRYQYHAGRTADLEMALAALPAATTAHGIAAVGYSLGGNMLLKFLGERGSKSPIRAAAAVSAPIDLAVTSDRMQRWRNRAYQAYLMREIRKEAVAPASDITPAERRAVLGARSIRDFDERFSAPRNGFAHAQEYYERNSARHYLGGVAVPTLVVHGANDPWVPAHPYRDYDWRGNPALLTLFPASGGHVGFNGRDGGTSWHDVAIARFLAAVFSPT